MSVTRIRVLHVEDSAGDARLMHEYLRDDPQASIDWLLARRVDEALERLATEPLDAVLLDLSLPDADGLETVRRICEAAPQVPMAMRISPTVSCLQMPSVAAAGESTTGRRRIR